MSFHSAASLRLLWNKANVVVVPTVVAAGLAVHHDQTSSRSKSGSSLRSRTTLCEQSLATKKPPVSLRQRMTLIGRFSIQSETPVNPSITSFFMSLSGDPLTPTDVKTLWEERHMSERHPRFAQRVAKDRPGYFEATQKPLNQYITETLYPTQDNVRQDLQRRIQHLQTATWDLGDSLWHLYVAPWSEKRQSAFPSKSTNNNSNNNRLSYVFFRAHHALADGASFTAAFMDLFDEADEFRAYASELMRRHGRKLGTWTQRLRRRILQWLRFLRGSVQAVWYQLRLIVLTSLESNPWRILQQQNQSTNKEESIGTQRVVSFVDAAAPVDQVKFVARQLGGPKATVNDVFVSCITAALTKQLQYHRSNNPKMSNLPNQRHMNISVPVHLRGGMMLPGESLGNRLGAFVVRLPGEDATNIAGSGDGAAAAAAASRLKAVHCNLYAMKNSMMPLVSHVLAKSLSMASHVLPSAWIATLYSRANADSIAVVTNVRGPAKAIHLGGRPVHALHGFVPLPPGIPVGVVVGSYNGNMTLTLSAEPWAIPDGDQFLSWVLEEYLTLLRAASHSTTITSRKPVE